MPVQTISGGNRAEIVASVEAALASGALAPGDRLPSVRSLASRLGLSPTTVAAAMAELRRRGLIVSRPRSGAQVAERPPLTALRSADVVVPPGVRDLANGSPDPAFLPDVWAVLRRLGGAPRLYGSDAVVGELRDAAGRTLAEDGLDPSWLCVTNGALDAIERVLAAHLTGGDAVAVEDPGFSGVLDLVRALGLAPLAVAVDARGMVPAALDAALRAGARAAVLTPRGQNPTGAAFDSRRAGELRRVLARHPDVLVVEDDHLGPVAGAEALTVTAGRSCWAAVRSVSKWLGPDLRLAALVGDEQTVSRVQGRQAVGPGWVSGVIQRAVAALWADPEVAGLAGQAATVYAGRRRALADALAAHGVAVETPSGLNVWVPVPAEDVVVGGLLAAGWAVGAGSRFRLQSPPAVRITTATLAPAEAPEVAAALAALLRPAGRTRAA